MATSHLSYGAEFGVAVTEDGLNRLSSGLRDARPEAFAYSTRIPIVPPSSGNPGHELTLYAVVDEPLGFNLYPVEQTPQIQRDGFFVKANVLFSLTDNRLGSVTRLRMIAEAAGQIVRTPSGLAIRLIPKPDGVPWFDIVSIEGEHPNAAMLVNGMIEARMELADVDPDADDPTARSFRAIMNYLITVFLREGLVRTVTEFPFPDMSQLVEAGPLGKLPGRDLFVRNNAFYLTLGNANPGDGSFPASAPRAHIAVGVSERGLDRIMDAMGQMPIPISMGDSNTTLRVFSSNFHVRKIKIDLRPGKDHFFGQVFFGGTITVRLQFKLFGGWIRGDVPLPIDDSLSQYLGLVRPFIKIVDEGKPSERFELRLEPDQKFFEAWAVLIKTDYKPIFREMFKRLIRSIEDKLIYKKLKKIPIIGWIVDFVINKVGEVTAWVLGEVLNAFVSTFLTILMNTVGRVVAQFIKRSEFRVLQIEQATVRELTGLSLRSGFVEQLEDNRGGELLLGLLFDQGHFPPAPVPVPLPDEPVPPTQPDPLPIPPLPSLPEYPSSAYLPTLARRMPQFPEGETHVYAIEAPGRTAGGTLSITCTRDAGGHWLLRKETELPGSAKSVAVARYDAEGLPLSATYEQDSPQRGEAEFSHSVDLTAVGKAKVSSVLGPVASYEAQVNAPDRVTMDFDEFWPFRLAWSGLAGMAPGKLARVELADPEDFTNWARIIPVEVTVTEDTESDPTGIGRKWVHRISARDEDGRLTAVVHEDEGLRLIEIQTPVGTVRLTRRS